MTSYPIATPSLPHPYLTLNHRMIHDEDMNNQTRPSKITADPLTDEEIRKFLQTLSAELDALDDSDRNGIAAIYDLRATIHVALSKGPYEPDVYETRKHLMTIPAARARIAAAINARKEVSK